MSELNCPLENKSSNLMALLNKPRSTRKHTLRSTLFQCTSWPSCNACWDELKMISAREQILKISDRSSAFTDALRGGRCLWCHQCHSYCVYYRHKAQNNPYYMGLYWQMSPCTQNWIFSWAGQVKSYLCVQCFSQFLEKMSIMPLSVSF